ncbi:MAG: CTP synthase [Candidatus Buchananbacteria bacterium RIFCSPHIGHO2_02_FULL_40_13]|uniref:CTP synthase n=1 Tax=Candidatus Buchananbacteria bacterium RIFCSPLOWO2_01_FULL_39_33 TaxID=1797543 RepID=A0A1G1YKT6_9BACT|nr:MAG: CTP synthase [Candidatus Buchananbacteria bacterium RIFCSPHIGHO2_01_FULL_40_35]OGY50886.1 MAG: CTP synthase [Candidatus Buchananbacteria bacterium RIFCSPHIGHO2_02_FULL_40_13]OGY52953.1 MAG: CTP synthase [Candidatus Buchananbacteria bacterium RIFCSPLOWO2_01_FULL_39_33]
MPEGKYIFVIGGVMSGVGKGIASASIGKILQARGWKVTAVKIDPYINLDAGTMNPLEHGEVFVTDDGDETDQDIGNYERFLDTNIYRSNYMTTGRVYQAVIERERNLEYGGKCVEVVPHIPLEVISRIKKAAQLIQADITIIEIGGTVGEYQNILFLEAARMLKLSQPQDVLFVLVSYLPVPAKIGEMKTKPTQTAVKMLNSAGLQPDFILGRADRPIDEPRKEKIALFCNVHKEEIISAPDTDIVYEIPINFEKDNLSEKILKKFNLEIKPINLADWQTLVAKINNAQTGIKIGIVGKYFETGDFILPDAYISVIESLKYAAWHWGIKPQIHWLNSDAYEDSQRITGLADCDCLVVPGGFGSRGIEGKIAAIKYARENKIPFLGLCYGMQLASIEFARHVCGLSGAQTTEIQPTAEDPIIHVMEEQAEKLAKNQYGNTMRLGEYPCVLKPGSVVAGLYGQLEITERHRHRYEFNNNYRDLLEEAGLFFSGTSPDDQLVEIIELPANIHPFFVGVQFHPEFKSRPLRPHPLFLGLIKAGWALQKNKNAKIL